MLPLIRSRPSEALTPDVAAMLSSLALMSNGQLHPDIVSALREAVAGGARLHPEMAELLRMDLDTAMGATAGASSSGSTGSSGAGSSGSTGSSSAGSSGAVSRAGPSGPSGSALAAASSAAAAAAASSSGKPQVEVAESPSAAAGPQVVEAKQEEDVEDAIAQLQNDTCLHSDEE